MKSINIRYTLFIIIFIGLQPSLAIAESEVATDAPGPAEPEGPQEQTPEEIEQEYKKREQEAQEAREKKEELEKKVQEGEAVADYGEFQEQLDQHQKTIASFEQYQDALIEHLTEAKRQELSQDIRQQLSERIKEQKKTLEKAFEPARGGEPQALSDTIADTRQFLENLAPPITSSKLLEIDRMIDSLTENFNEHINTIKRQVEEKKNI